MSHPFLHARKARPCCGASAVGLFCPATETTATKSAKAARSSTPGEILHDGSRTVIRLDDGPRGWPILWEHTKLKALHKLARTRNATFVGLPLSTLTTCRPHGCRQEQAVPCRLPARRLDKHGAAVASGFPRGTLPLTPPADAALPVADFQATATRPLGRELPVQESGRFFERKE